MMGENLPHSRILGSGLAIVSFLIYACTVFTLPQVRDARFCCETDDFAAAVSNVMYRAPLGTLFSGLAVYFFKHQNEPLSLTLEKVQVSDAGLPATPPDVLYKATRGGNGVGYMLVATAAFRMFGIHAWALPLTTLLLMAIAMAAFLLRFHTNAFASVVTLYFGALTVMLFTLLGWDPLYAMQIPVGGVRYFSLVGVLPTFYIFLTLLDSQPLQRGEAIRDGLLLALQTAILLLVVLTRGSALLVIAAVTLVWTALAWRHRQNRGRLRALLRKLAVMGFVSVGGLTAVVAAVPPDYLADGRFGPPVWERVTESLGANPNWPFPGVSEMFQCKGYAAMVPGLLDDNGHCIWFDYAAKHHIPIEQSVNKILDRDYEVAMREAFFELTARYPLDVLKTFFYYKFTRAIWSIWYSMHFNFNGDQSRARLPDGLPVIAYSPVALGLLLASLAISLAHFGMTTISRAELHRVAGVTLISALFTLPAYFIAWASPHTSGDLLLYCLMGFGLAVGTLLVSAQPLLGEHFRFLKVTESRQRTALRDVPTIRS
jgi:hypothetical protein